MARKSLAGSPGKRRSRGVAVRESAHQAPAGYNASEFPKPSVTCDTVILTVRDDRLSVLCIQRQKQPYEGFWALPGGFLDVVGPQDQQEDLHEAAERELAEETGLTGIRVEQVGAYGTPNRDPRDRIITIAYVALAPWDAISNAQAGDDARAVGWFPVKGKSAPDFAFDHRKILDDAVAHVRRRIMESAIAKPMLLGKTFFFAELRKVYETILGKKLDTRRLKRELLARSVIVAEPKKAGAADRYRFKNTF